ncbi:MAG: hypothetical protein JW744_03495 [Candidatus Diapherotrites archaeon]|uniref:Lipoprotein n=1 Tax=Candidatus Iainarchaeum sp. TaxID=3101447 RepID=A0A938YWP2_9ARCH|nr:hypothetical protein [Candidatus Diapherotrites archaeon]
MRSRVLITGLLVLAVVLSGCLNNSSYVNCGQIMPNDPAEEKTAEMLCFQNRFLGCNPGLLAIQTVSSDYTWQTNYEINQVGFSEEKCAVQQQFFVSEGSLKEKLDGKTITCTYSQGLAFNDFVYQKMSDRQFIETNCEGNAKEGVLSILDSIGA